MTPERWRRLDKIFARAVELEGNARAAWLEEACGDDSALRLEAEQLLAADSGQRTFTRLREAVRGAARDIQAEREQDEAEAGRTLKLTRIGAWRITGVLGAGAMGTVYRAERDDDRFHKQVAIKILRQGLESEFALARFRYERLILGGLDHANIAALIDGGEVDDRPYIVMELVEGRPVTDHCHELHLNLSERIRLFRQVCEAVQYAHQRLVIHRDIKPSNILVSTDGKVKLLDFGIAKLEDPDVRPEAAAETSTGMRLMTPGYASPEQVRGEDVSASSDIYSLGAVLYELLTGQKAHHLDRQDPAELLRVICQQDVALPSTVAPAESRRLLRGDLDNILSKALQKDETRRYSAVEQFSDDLTLYLEGRPVSARADTAFYRATKFLTRNRWATAMVALLAVSLAGGAGVSIYQARRAERRFEQVRGLARMFLFDVYDEVENLPGATRARQMLVSTASTYLNSLAADAVGDRPLSLEVAAAYQRVGDVLGNPYRANLGRAADARLSYGKSLAVAMQLAQGTTDGQAWRLVAWANIKAGSLLPVNVRQLQQGLEIANRISGWEGKPDPSLLMEAHRSLGDAWFRNVGWQAALQEFEACLDSGRGVAVSDVRLQATRIRCMQRAAKAQAATGDLDGGMVRFREALELLSTGVQNEPRHVEYRRNLLNVLLECGRWSGNPVNPNLGDVTGALKFLKEALELSRVLRAEDPHDELARNGEISALLGLAQTGALADTVRAQNWLAQGQAAAAALTSAGPKTAYLQQLADARGRLLEKQGRYTAATSELERSLAMLVGTVPGSGDFDHRSDVLAERVALAHSVWSSGNRALARQFYERELPTVATLLRERPDDFFLANMNADMFVMLARCERPGPRAVQRAQQAAGIWSAWVARGGKGAYAVRQRHEAEALALKMEKEK